MNKPKMIFTADITEEIVSMVVHRDKIVIATTMHIYEYENESFRQTEMVHSISDFPPVDKND